MSVLSNWLLILFLILSGPSAPASDSTDAEAKQDASLAVSAVSNYQANNRGKIPTSAEFNSADFKSKYLTDLSSKAQIHYSNGADCNGKIGQRLFSVKTTLANGDNYCLD